MLNQQRFGGLVQSSKIDTSKKKTTVKLLKFKMKNGILVAFLDVSRGVFRPESHRYHLGRYKKRALPWTLQPVEFVKVNRVPCPS